VGRGLFDVFPDNPDDPSATGESNLRRSLEAVIGTKAAHAMAVQKYDIPRPTAKGGGFEERYWSPLNTPVLSSGGEVTLIIHHVEDVTDAARLANVLEARGQEAEALGTRNAWLEAEITRARAAESKRDALLIAERKLTEQLREQATELAHQVDQAQALASELEASNEELGKALAAVERAAETQRRMNEELRALLDQSSLAIILFDTDNRVSAWNPAAERMFGWAAAEVIGQPAPYVPIDREGEGPTFRGQRLQGVPLTDATTVRSRKDGSLVEVSLSTAALYGPSGAVSGLVAFHTDITERLRLESELRQSQKMEAIGQLAGGVAHDFNNMLTAIKSNSDFLLMALDADDPRRHDAEEIAKAADRAAALTRQLLAFSRRQVLDPVVLDLNRIVTDMEKMLRRLLVGDVDIALKLAPTLWPIRADGTQLQQVVVNLVVNARDAMPMRGTVTIRTANIAIGPEGTGNAPGAALRPGNYVHFSVTDTGTGMTAETQARIFEPFFTTKEQGKGTGLGLATVYGIVRQSGGEIRVASEVGKGTTFDIYLPQAGELPESRSTSPAASGCPGEPTTAGRTSTGTNRDHE